MEYLHLNGRYELVQVQNRGICMFATIRRGVDVPREYKNTHLRGQMVMFIFQNVQFFFPLLKLSIKGNYGHARLFFKEYAEKERDGTLTPPDIADQKLPGHFSLYSYLHHVLTPNTWGEDIILTLVLMMWQIGITVAYAETLLQETLRHNRSYKMTD